MLKIMLNIVVVVLIAVAGDIELVQYSDLRLSGGEEDRSTLLGNWVLENAKHGENITIFSDRISGSDGCNKFSAELIMSGQDLKTGVIMSTRAFCENLKGDDLAFTIKLANVSKYNLDPQGKLNLLSEKDELLFVFVKE